MTELYRSAWRVMDAINMAYEVHLDIEDVSHLQELEYGFAAKSRQHTILRHYCCLGRLPYLAEEPGKISLKS